MNEADLHVCVLVTRVAFTYYPSTLVRVGHFPLISSTGRRLIPEAAKIRLAICTRGSLADGIKQHELVGCPRWIDLWIIL